MLKISLIFAATAVAALFVVDLEITTLHPWIELSRMAKGALTPDFTILPFITTALLNTLTFALCGIFLAIVMGTTMAFFFEYTPVRLFCAFIRAVHEIFWAFILMHIVGLNPICGVLAIAIPYSGVIAKVYAEIRQESNHRPLEGIPIGASNLSNFLYGVLPVIYADIKNYTAYRFECALRSSAVLGFIGLPTLGYYLETAFREGMYSEVAALLYCFYLMIASLKLWTRSKFIIIPLMLAIFLISKEVAISTDNIVRFFTYDILPWPMRREGMLDGTRTVQFPLGEVFTWAMTIFRTDILEGIVNTVLLTQIALVATGIFSLIAFPLACSHYVGKYTRGVFHFVLIVIRTTPEYILAYILLLLWGPSMLPAIFAIFLHNGAILSYITSGSAELINLQIDAPRRRNDRYLYEILPRVYGQFLAFLFYRWEIMMRETAILGILGIYTLGFYIDSAITNDHIDTAILIILVAALLNMIIDTCSQIIRKRLKISSKLITE